MKRKYQVAVAGVLIIGLISTGIAALEIQKKDKYVDDFAHLHLQPHNPSITNSPNGVELSVGVVGTGWNLTVKNVTVYSLDEKCDSIGRVSFGTIEGSGDRLTDDRRTMRLQTVPRYLVVDVPDRYNDPDRHIFPRGLERTSDTRTNGSYDWTLYEIADHDDRSTWCDRRR